MSITRNTDPLTITITVEQAEALRDCLLSFTADCGIPLDDAGEPLAAVLAAIGDALDAVPLITLGVAQ